VEENEERIYEKAPRIDKTSPDPPLAVRSLEKKFSAC
jgi:hypothetical protein